MTRNIAEQSKAISIFWLKKHDYLNKDYAIYSGILTWTHKNSNSNSGIGFTIIRNNWGTPQEKTHLELRYIYNKIHVKIKIELVTTPCNYGGVRYWFKCPVDTCTKRVGIIYCTGKEYVCRYCGDIAYAEQFTNNRYRTGSITELDIEQALSEIKLTHYNGKITRKYNRYLRLKNKMKLMWKKIDTQFGIYF